MTQALTTIKYVCQYCSQLRTIPIDTELIHKQLDSPVSNGLVELIDPHVCKNNIPKFISIEIDSSLRVRKQSAIEPLHEKELLIENKGIPIPKPNTSQITITQNHVQIIDFPLTKEKIKPYIQYVDNNNKINIELNLENKPPSIPQITEPVTIWTESNNPRIIEWLNLLKDVNTIIQPKQVELIMYQFLLIQQKLSKDQKPTAHNTQEFMQIALLPEIIIQLTDPDAPGIFDMFGKTIMPEPSINQTAKDMLTQIKDQKPLKEIILTNLKEKMGLLKLITIINTLNQYGLIEIIY